MNCLNRREFLSRSLRRASGITAGAVALAGVSRSVLGANERVNFALIGCGGRGRMVTRNFLQCGARLAYVCDLHDERRRQTLEEMAEVQGRKPKEARSIRQVLDSKDVDAVLVATPDHWHGPASVLACQAGKHVYVEKPHAHNIWESRKMIEAARKYNRALQVGTQNRSAPYNLAALEYVKSGRLGGVHLVKVYNLKPGGAFHLGDPGRPPAGFDWDAWLGPAPERPYHQRIFHGGWHKFWDFSGGDMADDGIHQLDLAMMLMGDPGIPTAVSCSGGRLAHRGDDSEVPDLQVVTYDFDDFVLTFELSGYPRYMQKTTGTIRRNDEFPYWTQNATRIELYGSELMMTIGRHGGGWIVTTSGGKIVEKMYGRPPDVNHVQNFLDCVKSRRNPNADVEILHKSVALVHLGNIAHRVGNCKLRFDPKAERFIGSVEANNLVKRRYRKKYEIPQQV
ncbi:MAG: Gfo/Idh/MocA family oxidoreductase [Phycisphaerales bacterium]|nr:MAG: Gfo/Idh/MocA family oxidoreductase [Phycisphaerales bacterium]